MNSQQGNLITIIKQHAEMQGNFNFCTKQMAVKTKLRSNQPCHNVTRLEMNLIPKLSGKKSQYICQRKNVRRTLVQLRRKSKLKYHFEESTTPCYEHESVEETDCNVPLFIEPLITDKTQEVHPIMIQQISLKLRADPSRKVNRPQYFFFFLFGFTMNIATHS